MQFSSMKIFRIFVQPLKESKVDKQICCQDIYITASDSEQTVTIFFLPLIGSLRLKEKILSATGFLYEVSGYQKIEEKFKFVCPKPKSNQGIPTYCNLQQVETKYMNPFSNFLPLKQTPETWYYFNKQIFYLLETSQIFMKVNCQVTYEVPKIARQSPQRNKAEGLKSLKFSLEMTLAQLDGQARMIDNTLLDMVQMQVPSVFRRSASSILLTWLFVPEKSFAGLVGSGDVG